MNWIESAVLSEVDQLEAFEASLVEVGRLEKRAGDFSEYTDQLLESGTKTPHLDRLVKQTKLAYRMGQELAKEAGIAGEVWSAVKPLAGKVLTHFAEHPQHALAAGGATIGALGGAATAQSGHRLSGALGGAALGGAAGYGASKLPGGMGSQMREYASGVSNMGLNRMHMPMKFASAKTAGLLSTTLGKAGVGAAVGGALGMFHKSQPEKMGLTSGHHLRNALLGAAGGAAAGGAIGAVPGLLHGAEEAANVERGAQAVEHAAAGAPKVTGAFHPVPVEELQQQFHAAPPMHPEAPSLYQPGPDLSEADRRHMQLVRNNANSYDAHIRKLRRAEEALKLNVRANPGLHGALSRAFAAIPEVRQGATSFGKSPLVNPYAATSASGPAAMAKLAHRGGREFLKLAFSMSAQAEQGDPTGAQEPEANSQFIARPQRVSPPAKQLYDSLKHLSPSSMPNLQVAQSDT